MGSAMANALTRGGARVVATVAARSKRTAQLADRAHIELLPDLAAVVETAEVVLSIVPPEAAPKVAGDVLQACRDQDVRPLLVDLNAIAPATALRIETAAATTGCEVVDGSISGPPPWQAGTTRVYLSGERAEKVAVLPLDGAEWIVVGSEVGSASAVKMEMASVQGATLRSCRHFVRQRKQRPGVSDLRRRPGLVTNVERRRDAAAKSGGT
jgi:3-hydroxyisobutyrate dehydrogenase-like beta-hydroxyacid dehydrogenase